MDLVDILQHHKVSDTAFRAAILIERHSPTTSKLVGLMDRAQSTVYRAVSDLQKIGVAVKDGKTLLSKFSLAGNSHSENSHQRENSQQREENFPPARNSHEDSHQREEIPTHEKFDTSDPDYQYESDEEFYRELESACIEAEEGTPDELSQLLLEGFKKSESGAPKNFSSREPNPLRGPGAYTEVPSQKLGKKVPHACARESFSKPHTSEACMSVEEKIYKEKINEQDSSNSPLSVNEDFDPHKSNNTPAHVLEEDESEDPRVRERKAKLPTRFDHQPREWFLGEGLDLILTNLKDNPENPGAQRLAKDFERAMKKHDWTNQELAQYLRRANEINGLVPEEKKPEPPRNDFTGSLPKGTILRKREIKIGTGGLIEIVRTKIKPKQVGKSAKKSVGKKRKVGNG